MSGTDLKLRPNEQARRAVGNLGHRVARFQAAQTAGLAVELSNLMWGADSEGRTTFVSDALLEAAGYERDELTGQPLSRLLTTEDGAPTPDQVVGQFLGGERRLPMTLLARDGSSFRITWEAMPRRDRNGRLVEVIGVAREVLPTPEADSMAEQQFELLDAARLCVIGMQTDGTIFFFNREAEATLGYGRGEVKGRNYFELFAPRDDSGRSWREIKEHVAACLEAREYESAVVAKDGRRLVLRWSSTPLQPGPKRTGARKPDEVFIFGVDITEERRRKREARVRADIAALASTSLGFESYFGAVQHHLTQLMAFDAAAFIRYDPAGDSVRPMLVSGQVEAPDAGAIPAGGTATGAAIMGRRPYVCCHAGAGELTTDRIAAENGLESYVAVPLVTNGEPLGAFVIAATPLEAFGEREVAFLDEIAPHLAAAFNNHLLRTELDEARADYRVLFEQAHEGVLVLDPDLRCVEANAAACRMLGVPGRKLVGRTCAEILSPERPESVQKKLVELERAPACSLGELVLPCKEGAPLEIEAYAARTDDRGVFVLVTDVTERNRLRRESEESTRQIRWLVRSAGDGIALIKRGRLAYVNPGLVRLFGYKAADELEGRPAGLLYAPGESERLQEQGGRLREQEGRVPSRHEFLGRKRNGVVFPLEARAATFGRGERTTMLVLRDLSERKQLDGYIRRTQRIAGMAELASSIAHNFNSLLVTILGSTTIVRSLTPDDPRHAPLLGRIRDAASRAAELTSQLLGYTQGGRYVVEPVSLNQVASDTLAMLKGCIPRGVRVTTDLMPELPAVEGDPHQFTQVVLQAVLNAIEAMPEGGVLAVTSETFTAHDEIDPDRPGLRPGRYVRLVVSDTGCGMDQQTLRRVCEPFFTTRGAGRGLGMAAARGIVTRHNGFLTLTSSPGEGTDIEVLLPTPETPLQRKEGT